MVPGPAFRRSFNHVISLLRQGIVYRELIAAFVGRELRARYKGSLLGGAWLLLQPVIFLAVYYTVFIEILQFRMLEASDIGLPAGGADTSLLLAKVSALSMFVALVPWTVLQEAVVRSPSVITDNGNMIKKISFPAELLPVCLVGYGVVNLLVGIGVFMATALIVLDGNPFTAMTFALPLVIAVQAILMLGIAYLLSSVSVFIRDIAQVIPILCTVWFFFTPIFYFKLPKPEYQWVFDWNPAALLVNLHRVTLLGGRLPTGDAATALWWPLAKLAAFSFVVLLIGYSVFMAKKQDFADEL